jgi:hypothetical protein
MVSRPNQVRSIGNLGIPSSHRIPFHSRVKIFMPAFANTKSGIGGWLMIAYSSRCIICICAPVLPTISNQCHCVNYEWIRSKRHWCLGEFGLCRLGAVATLSAGKYRSAISVAPWLRTCKALWSLKGLRRQGFCFFGFVFRPVSFSLQDQRRTIQVPLPHAVQVQYGAVSPNGQTLVCEVDLSCHCVTSAGA